MHEYAVELLQEAYYALSGVSRFRDAVLDGGVFESILSQSHSDDGDYDFEDISTALEYEVEARYDHTGHARSVFQHRDAAFNPSPERVRGSCFTQSG